MAVVFGGSAMLTVLYANGEGIEKNIPLAIRFACEQGWAPAEFEGRINHLVSLMRNAAPGSSRFTFCDDITSGFMMGYCAAYGKELDDQSRDDSMRALASGWPGPQRVLFGEVVKAQHAYVLAHVSGEIDADGTMRAERGIAAEQRLLNEFLAALQRFEKGGLPGASKAAFAAGDLELNNVYREVMADAEKQKSNICAVQPEGIRDAERAWLKYRDAWVAFAKLRYLAVGAETWLTLLTNDRIAVLKGMTCEMGSTDESCNN